MQPDLLKLSFLTNCDLNLPANKLCTIVYKYSLPYITWGSLTLLGRCVFRMLLALIVAASFLQHTAIRQRPGGKHLHLNHVLQFPDLILQQAATNLASITDDTPWQVKIRLKTSLYHLAHGTWSGAFLTVYAVRLAPCKCLTYLLTYLLNISKLVLRKF